jgi:hypothetical protein
MIDKTIAPIQVLITSPQLASYAHGSTSGAIAHQKRESVGMGQWAISSLSKKHINQRF